MRRKFTLSFLAVFLAVSFTRAQIPSMVPANGVLPAILNSAGGSFDNPTSYFRYEWSVGELVLVQAFAPADSSVLVTQGVLQPCTDMVMNSPQTLIFDNGDYKLFPNPTEGKFEVNFFVKESGTMSLQLINALGQVMERRTSRYDGCCRIELFDLSKHPNGVYYVVADLKPDNQTSTIEIIRHSGLKVIKASK